MKDETLKRIITISKKVTNIVITTILVILLITIGYLMFQKYKNTDKVPNLFGFKFLQIMSGSMSGVFEVDDTIIIKSVKGESQINVGDIVTFDENSDTLVTHRIVAKDEENGTIKYTTKGDANNAEDTEKIIFSQIEGKYVCKITSLGEIVSFANSKMGMAIIVSIPVIVLVLFVIVDQRKDKKKNARMEKRLKHELEVLTKYEKNSI